MAENPLEGDKVIEKDGLRIFVDEPTSKALSGTEIDYVDDGKVQGFVLRSTGTSQDSGCGCC